MPSESQQIGAIAFTFAKLSQLMKRVIVGRQFADGGEEFFATTVRGRAGIGTQQDFDDRPCVRCLMLRGLDWSL